jgi:shikimate dehydrogenase
MLKFGLIGKKLGHSFSKIFFDQLFKEQHISALFNLIEMDNIAQFEKIKTEGYVGLSVTLPFKETIIPYLDELDESAAEIGAVNCVFFKNGKSIGYNTDTVGFALSLSKILINRKEIKKALVLGNGGAAKAVSNVLGKLNIEYKIVSRNPESGQIAYADLDSKTVKEHKLIVNCSPLGMLPNTRTFPDIPYSALDESNILFDLVYNPAETVFMQRGKEQNATVCNGLEMFHLQAMAAWNIWNS